MSKEDAKQKIAFDAAVHPRMAYPEQINEYTDGWYKQLVYNRSNRFYNPVPTGVAPFGEWLEQSRPTKGETIATAAGNRPIYEAGAVAGLAQDFLRNNGVQRAVLTPMLRGIIPAADQGNAVCAAYNDWLADTWLAETDEDVEFLGTIRVNPMDSASAVKEIERWASNGKMVQIGVPVESQHPYGQRYFLDIWEAAAAHGLPVIIKSEGAMGIDLPVSILGTPRTHIEYSMMHRDRFFHHVASFIAEGVFDRFPDLRIISADGGFDMLAPAIWRMDMDWPITRTEVPWVKKAPSEYLKNHVRFVASKLEGPPDSQPDTVIEWAQRTGAADLLIYGSGYPLWSAMTPDELLPALSAEDRERILWRNAYDLYEPRLAKITSRDTATARSSASTPHDVRPS
ncbi:amidohydrolase [Rhizobium tropici]|uniref:Amidohydrolase n=1 Tax=Rhizobium tropici TaxID=398 RepID=A0A5B0VQS9_RHITR|nr:amidohydrolase family protein [Rhizobium tropici]KAA1176977.1 amidohydrolase [Rhizobium tropici]